MTLFYQETLKIILLLLFSFYLECIILVLSLKLSIHNPDTEKLSAYECGFDPKGQNMIQPYQGKIHIVSFFFLLFVILISVCCNFIFYQLYVDRGMEILLLTSEISSLKNEIAHITLEIESLLMKANILGLENSRLKNILNTEKWYSLKNLGLIKTLLSVFY
jgi:NADH:ubiquinone oxidoreductase subunit 3 (subunit A)